MKTLDAIPVKKLDGRPLKTQLDTAISFFGASDLVKEPDSLSFLSDKDGLVTFICGIGLEHDPHVVKKMIEMKDVLISILTVVTSYINRYTTKYGKDKKTNVDLWTNALNHIPLMGPSAIENQVYKKNTAGIEIATSFINIILGVAAKEGDSLTRFKDFLKIQGDSLKLGLEKDVQEYHTINTGVSVEVFRVGDEIVYVPSIKQYQIDFTRENSKWSSSCISYQSVEINFSYKYSAHVFDYEALDDPDIKRDFDDFISKQRKTQIRESNRFYNGDF